MISLYSIKPWFLRRLRRVEDLLVRRRVSPDALTVAAVGVSLLAGGAIAAGAALEEPAVWLAVPPLVLARLALNALDGSVARRTRRERPFGLALNEVGDRVGDAATIGAAGFVAPPSLAIGAVAAAFLCAQTGALSATLTGRRDTGGPMGKADRAAAIALAALAGALAGSALPFTIVLWAVLGGSLLTAVLRLVRLRRACRERALTDLVEPYRVERDALDALPYAAGAEGFRGRR